MTNGAAGAQGGIKGFYRMRRIVVSLLLAGGLSVAGCATGGANGPFESLLKDGLRTSDDFGRVDPAFREAAVNACTARAAPYGEPTVTRTQKGSMDVLIVDGVTVRASRPQRAFTCSFRSDGAITQFLRG